MPRFGEGWTGRGAQPAIMKPGITAKSVALLFLAVLVLSSKIFLWLNVIGLATCLAALAVLKVIPRLLISSITNQPVRKRITVILRA